MGGVPQSEVLRPRLIAASIYIAGFEALKDSVVGRLRDFFLTGFSESGNEVDPRYQSEVLTRNASPVYASLDWLRERKAIDDADLAAFDRVKLCRNTLSHKLFNTLARDGLPSGFEQRFVEMVALLRKVEVWWIINVEVPTNPDYDGREVDEGNIVPGPVMGMQRLLDIALGDSAQSRFYHDEFRKSTGSDQAFEFLPVGSRTRMARV